MVTKRREQGAGGRTVWHMLFADLMRERRSPDFNVLADMPLSTEPQRADLLLLRKRRRQGRLARGGVLRGLWPRLGSDTIVEFKSVTRPLRRGDFIRLLGYGAQYHARHAGRLVRGELRLVLVVPRSTRALATELGRLGFRLGEAEGGYAPLEAEPYGGWVVFLDQVERVEGDDVLSPFVRGTLELEGPARQWWFDRLLGTPKGASMADMSKMEGYVELVGSLLARVPRSKLAGLLAKVPPEVLAQLPAEKRLAGLSVDERLAGLSADERLAGLSADELEALAIKLHRRTARPAKARRPLGR